MLTPEARIKLMLTDIETENGVSVLYAVESGSRAWGLASPDSDYDVRFIFTAPAQRYLQMSAPPPTLEKMDFPYDLSGWDIFKTMTLAKASNPSLIEWLFCDTRYVDGSNIFIIGLREAIEKHYSAFRLMKHYVALTNREFGEGNFGKNISVKKYVYVLRPILAALWMVQHEWKIPPVGFNQLLREVEGIGAPVLAEIEDWKNRKHQAFEGAQVAPYPLIEEWVTHMLAGLKSLENDAPDREFPEAPLNALLRRVVTCR